MVTKYQPIKGFGHFPCAKHLSKLCQSPYHPGIFIKILYAKTTDIGTHFIIHLFPFFFFLQTKDFLHLTLIVIIGLLVDIGKLIDVQICTSDDGICTYRYCNGPFFLRTSVYPPQAQDDK